MVRPIGRRVPTNLFLDLRAKALHFRQQEDKLRHVDPTGRKCEDAAVPDNSIRVHASIHAGASGVPVQHHLVHNSLVFRQQGADDCTEAITAASGGRLDDLHLLGAGGDLHRSHDQDQHVYLSIELPGRRLGLHHGVQCGSVRHHYYFVRLPYESQTQVGWFRHPR